MNDATELNSDVIMMQEEYVIIRWFYTTIKWPLRRKTKFSYLFMVL